MRRTNPDPNSNLSPSPNPNPSTNPDPYLTLTLPQADLTLLQAVEQAAVAKGPSACDIDGFDTFCEHWIAGTSPPASAMSSDDGRCLYSRMGGIDTEKKLLEHNVGGGHQKITFVGGPDHVMKLSKWHKSPEGRGYATLGVGWPNPSTDTGYWYLVFAAPCPNSKWQVPSQRIPAIPRHPTPIMNVAGYGVAGLVSRAPW